MAIGGWAFEVGLMGLATSWLITTTVAYYTIRIGLVALHKEWMIRAYVVTFAFVFFRILSDYSPRWHAYALKMTATLLSRGFAGWRRLRSPR